MTRASSQQDQAVTHEDEHPAISFVQVCLAAIAVVAMLWLLHATRHVTMPLGFAIFIAVLLVPIQTSLMKHVPRPFAHLAAVLALIAIYATFFSALALTGKHLANQLAQDSIVNTFGRIEAWLAEQLPWQRPQLFGGDNGSMTSTLGKQLLFAVETILLSLVFAALALVEAPELSRRVNNHLEPARAKRLREVGGRVVKRCQHYMLVRTVNGALAGLLAFGLCAAVGLSSPWLWGLVTWLLYYIPTLGHIGAAIPPALLAWHGPGGWRDALLLAAGFFAIEFVIGEYLDPRMQGAKGRVAPVLVLASVLFWGWVWGIPGAILGVPITFTLMTVLSSFSATKSLAVVLGQASAKEDD